MKDGKPTVINENITIPEQVLLSDTIRLARDGLAKAIKHARVLGRPIHIGPESSIETLHILYQLAVRVEKLEGVEHEQIPEPSEEKEEPDSEPSTILTV